MAVFDTDQPLVMAFGILGNVVSVIVYIAPYGTFKRIVKKKSTMGYECLPYVMSLFSAMLWMYYALVKTAILLITINSLGCVVQSIYIFIFLVYATKESRLRTFRLLGWLNLGLFSLIFGVAQFALKDTTTRISAVGWICVAFSVAVFVAPLSIVFQVLRTRSAEFMPFALSCALTASAVCWFLYGTFTHDICVAIPNVAGFLLGVVQVVLYMIFRSPKPPIHQEDVEVDEQAAEEAEKKLPLPLQLPGGDHVINIVMLGGNPDQVRPIKSCQVSPDDDADSDDNNNRMGILRGTNHGDEESDEGPSGVSAQVNVVHIEIECSPVLVACPA